MLKVPFSTSDALSERESVFPMAGWGQTLKDFEESLPEIVFEWYDKPTGARGYLVINSLRGGAAGGGTRLRKGLSQEEMLSLAKTMELKFTVAGPSIGGAKSGIDFDPLDPRKEEVLQRWFAALMPILQRYYGTGGDLNVDEGKEVVPITQAAGLKHPQEGILVGHFGVEGKEKEARIARLRMGLSQLVKDSAYTPAQGFYTVSDLITGYGVAEALRHYYRLWGGALAEKRAIIQGWGNVAAAAALYLAHQGVAIVGIIDRAGGILSEEGLSYEEIKQLFLDRKGNTLHAEALLPFEEVQRRIWDIGAHIFVPAAASRLVTEAQAERMIATGTEVIACGANVPFKERSIFYGSVTKYVDERIALVPDFVASAAMARAFAYLMGDSSHNKAAPSDIFADCSACLSEALEKIRPLAPDGKHITKISLHEALQRIT